MNSIMKSGYLSELEFLVAEDNEFARKIVRDVLKALGAPHPHFAANGVEAMDLTKNFPVDIALVDWDMPLVDGIEFTEFIRHSEDSPNPFLPIIMMTAFTEHTKVIEARDKGVNEYLVKPFSAAQLLKRIEMAVEHPRPYVRTKGFFGPDRRRRVKSAYKGQERRALQDKEGS